MNRLNIAGLALALMVGGPGLADSHGHKKHSHGIMKKMGQTMEGLTAVSYTHLRAHETDS